jgi:hypothetical protein
MRIAALLGVTLFAVAVCGEIPGAAEAPSADSASSTYHRSAVSGRSNKALTLRELRQVIAAVPRLPGGHPAASSPSPPLDEPQFSVASRNKLDLARWWTAPGSMHAALAYLRAHPLRGFTLDGSGTGSGPDGVVDSLTFAGPSGTAYAELSLGFAVTRFGHGVAVRAETQAVWMPQRTAAETIAPAHLVFVSMTVIRPGLHPPIRQTVIGTKADNLAFAFNRLPLATPGAYACPMSRGYIDRLVFHLRTGPNVVAQASIDGCREVSVVVAHRDQTTLTGDVHRAVSIALH